MKTISSFFGLLAILVMSGCSTIPPAQHFGELDLNSLWSAYVVIAPRGNPNIGSYIVTALAHRNIKTNIGALKDKPAETAFYVTYEDHWNWDLAVYLDTLDVNFFDNATGKLIAVGTFRNSKLAETWPNPRDKTIEVVNSMFASNRK